MVLPCPVCGKGINLRDKGRTFPEYGTIKRRDFCIALGVPENTYDHIRTRRKVCFSHYDEEEFYRGRHILKHSALPRELTEREKFILFNSDFNKPRRIRPMERPLKQGKEVLATSKYGIFESTSVNGVTKVRFKTNKIVPNVQASRAGRRPLPSNTFVGGSSSASSSAASGIRIAEGITPADPTQPKLYFIILPPPDGAPANNQIEILQGKNGYAVVQKNSSSINEAQINSASRDINTQQSIKQKVKEPSIVGSCFSIFSSQTNDEYGSNSELSNQKFIKQEVLEPASAECSSNALSHPLANDLPSTSLHKVTKIFNDDQVKDEVGISSNTSLILSRCLQYS
uniref:THAP-type domain-containing protein n=1 Tax=Panagrolaimus sp. ES5 TaxID=591445 RepID=A0AC34FAS0_9BILA